MGNQSSIKIIKGLRTILGITDQKEISFVDHQNMVLVTGHGSSASYNLVFGLCVSIPKCIIIKKNKEEF